jgi:two-component system nitrogen regulation sensor histidine kinase GlnL
MDLTSMLEDWPFPVFQLADGDRIVWANLSAQEWLGLSLRKLVDRVVWDIMDTDPDSRSITGTARQTSGALTTRDVMVSKSGQEERQPTSLTAYVNGAYVGLSVWFTGPQPREAKIGGQVVSGMGRLIAHELKNPLAGIKGAAQLLRDDVDSEEGLALIDLIGSEIDRIGRLADRMESLGDVDPTSVERVNAHEILRQARRIIQSAYPDIVFTEKYDPSLPHVAGHADTLMQAVLNLIKNAAEASGPKGEIRLKTSFRSGVKGARRGGAAGQQLPVQISVRDNGPGIPADMQQQVFQPFVTTKSDGQGLGLALVSKVAAAHGGLVELFSTPGETTFSLLLPAPGTKDPT